MDFLPHRNQVAAHFLLVDGDDVAPTESYRPRADRFLAAAGELYDLLDTFETVDIPDGEVETKIQEQFYNVGKKHYGEDKATLLLWFRDLYTLLRDQQAGPRIGQFARIVGVDHFNYLLKGNIETPFTFKYDISWIEPGEPYPKSGMGRKNI